MYSSLYLSKEIAEVHFYWVENVQGNGTDVCVEIL